MRTALLVAVIALAGCGGDGSELQVYAAASLRDVLPRIAPAAEFNFGGSNELVTQILDGAPADVFVSADDEQAARLDRMLQHARPIATNRLVIVVSLHADVAVGDLADAAKRDVRLVLGDVGVPVGDYAREAFERAGVPAVRNVVSYERDAKGVLAKVVLGEADAGVVYVTDARAAAEDVVTVAVPDRLQPDIRYVAGIVAGTDDADAAIAFLERLTGEEGRRELRRAGFGTP